METRVEGGENHTTGRGHEAVPVGPYRTDGGRCLGLGLGRAEMVFPTMAERPYAPSQGSPAVELSTTKKGSVTAADLWFSWRFHAVTLSVPLAFCRTLEPVGNVVV